MFLGDVSVSGWPENQPLAHGGHWSVIQYRRHQASKYGRTHRGR